MDPAARGRPSSVHLLADGRVLASKFLDADDKCSVRIHSLNVDSNEALSAPSTSFDGLESVNFPLRADFFVTREKGRLRVRDAFTGAIRRELPGVYPDFFPQPAISPDGRYLAIALNGDPVVVLDLVMGAERARRSFGIQIAVVELSPDGNVLAAVEWNGLTHVWDLPNRRSHVIKPDTLERGRGLHYPVFSLDGSTMATATAGNPGGAQPVAVWDSASGRRLGVLPYANGQAFVFGFAGTSRSLILSSDRSPLVWHFDPTPDPPSPAGHKDEAWAAAYSPDGKILATGSDDTDEPQTIKLWDPATGKLIRGWNGESGTVASLAFAPDSQTLASGHLTFQDNVKLWDVATGSVLRSLRGHHDFVRTLAFSPDGRTLASAGGSNGKASADLTVRVRDVSAARCVQVLADETDVVRSLAFCT